MFNLNFFAMKKITTLSLLLMLIISSISINAQTLIATSKSPNATANHNQRKIVRYFEEQILVVYEDIKDGVPTIMGVKYNGLSDVWSEPYSIVEGVNPTLVGINEINPNLIYQTLDPISRINRFKNPDSIEIGEIYTISDTAKVCKMPVADCIYAFWVQENEDGTESLISSSVFGENSYMSMKCLAKKNTIDDISVANDLMEQEFPLDVYVAFQYNNDSIQGLYSPEYMNEIDTIYECLGHEPCISFSGEEYDFIQKFARFFYKSIDGELIEVEVLDNDAASISSRIVCNSGASNVCIDDIAPPIGFSYLYLKEGNLYHAFSYGVHYYWTSVLDTIAFSAKPISNPSIAYKEFNFAFVDYVWMEANLNSYDIYYKRDAKHEYGSGTDKEKGKGFEILISPNPFKTELLLEISTENNNKYKPQLVIYNQKSQCVKTLDVIYFKKRYTAVWDGTNEQGQKLSSGVYVILCTVGNKRTARKIVFKP